MPCHMTRVVHYKNNTEHFHIFRNVIHFSLDKEFFLTDVLTLKGLAAMVYI